MAFNFDAAKADAKKTSKTGIFAVVLGARGSAKSGTSAGTWGDKRVLLLLSVKEHHGKASALGINPKGQLTTVWYDRVGGTTAGKLLTDPDKIILNLMDILGSKEDIKKSFDVIVVDGLSALDPVIQAHSTVERADSYSKSKAVLKLYDGLQDSLKELHLEGLDVVVTCATEAFKDPASGDITETPKLRGRGAVESFVGAASEILHIAWVDKIINEGEDNESVETIPAFCFNTHIEKSGTKMNGRGYEITVNPRIAGVPKKDLPGHFPANFETLKKFKEKKLK